MQHRVSFIEFYCIEGYTFMICNSEQYSIYKYSMDMSNSIFSYIGNGKVLSRIWNLAMELYKPNGIYGILIIC